MVELATLPTRDLNALFEPLTADLSRCASLTCAEAGSFPSGDIRYVLRRFVFSGPPAEHDRIRLGLFAGVHGDEPAGCATAVKFLSDLAARPEQARGYDLFVYPVCNPTGYVANIRENRAGFDLNREFWLGSRQPEVVILERELRAHCFDGLITLHSDDTCDGIYGYAHGQVLNEALLAPAIRAAERILPRDSRAVIDGFAAREGLICDCFKGVLAAPPEQHPRPFDVIFETPGRAEFGLQVDAGALAVEAMLENHRGFAAYAQDL
jgi:murein peptide amidase A